MIKHLTPREFPKEGVHLVHYNGSYPILCSGQLTMVVNGKVFTFASHNLKTGGSVSFDKDWQEIIEKGPWEIDEWPEGYPEEHKEKTLQIINEELPYGCCGGCV